MTYLLDSNILGRLANTADAWYAVAFNATVKLHQSGEVLHITAQNLIEFRNFATRPVTMNGLGLSVPAAEAQAAGFEAQFPLLPETADILSAWKMIVHSANVISKRVHDARLVAVCHVHQIANLLTFNTADFSGLAAVASGVIIVDPATV